MRRVSVLAASMCVVAGCYDYHPLTTPSPTEGSYVAATLTDAGSADLAPSLGPDVFVVRGRYLGTGEGGAGGGGVVVSAAPVELQRGKPMPWARQAIRLPREAV